MREKEQGNNMIEKKGLTFSEKDKEEKKNDNKKMFSADLTIAFALVTVLSVSCSFDGWSIQIQRLEGEFWIPICVESHGMTVLVCCAPCAVAN